MSYEGEDTCVLLCAILTEQKKRKAEKERKERKEKKRKEKWQGHDR